MFSRRQCGKVLTREKVLSLLVVPVPGARERVTGSETHFEIPVAFCPLSLGHARPNLTLTRLRLTRSRHGSLKCRVYSGQIQTCTSKKPIKVSSILLVDL